MSAVQFFFEPTSPYSYLASLRIDAIAAASGRTVDWCPIDILQVWQAHGITEAYGAVRTLKRTYVLHDALRCARALGVPYATPRMRARDTTPLKLAYWGLAERDAMLARRFMQSVWRRYFVEGGAIDALADLQDADAGWSLDTLERAAALPTALAAHERANAAAIGAGCFGVPWFMADGEPFFGQDRLDQLAAHLAAAR